ncbi:MAG TPA: YdcF family protein [Rhabdaerophilum sp.]|nr:YdcF family protein [Rhabdaerophilum sp.]
MTAGSRFAKVAFLGAVMASAVVTGILIFAASLERREPRDVAMADGIVVVTGGADRISEALSLMERGKGRRLLISGVNTQSTPEQLRRRWPGREELFQCCVDLDYQARNTYGNAIESRAWAKRNNFRSLVLVTASYHLPRTMLEFSAAMPDIEITGFPVVPEASKLNRWWQEPPLMRIIVMEFFKYWAAVLRVSLGFPAR